MHARYQKPQLGLTLIEILIILVMLGILAAVAVPMVRERILAAKHQEEQVISQSIVDSGIAMFDSARDAATKDATRFPDAAMANHWGGVHGVHDCCKGGDMCTPDDWTPSETWSKLRFEPGTSYRGAYYWVPTSDGEGGWHAARLYSVVDADCDGIKNVYVDVLSNRREGKFLDQGKPLGRVTHKRLLVDMPGYATALD